MKKYLALMMVVASVSVQSSVSFGRPPIYPRPGHGNRNNGPDPVALAVSATFLSLSALSQSERNHRVTMIQQAETEALNYDAKVAPSAVFMNAKSTVEDLNGQPLNNEQAADMIVELNQKFREEE